MNAPDTPSLLAELRYAVALGDAADPNEMARLGVALDAAVRRVNGQIAGCLELLADAPPALRDACADLVSPDVDAFRVLLDRFQLPPAAPVDLETLRRLEQRSRAASALEPLLKEYRKLNLQRAPLSRRMAVARRLVATDPANPAWLEDLKGLEAARFREIARTIDESRAAIPEADLRSMVDDLTGPEVRQRPDAGIVRRVTEAHDAARRARFVRELDRLAPVVAADYAAQDFDALAAALAEVDELVALERFELPERIDGQLLEARRWHDKQAADREQARACEADCEAMRRLLERRHRAGEVRALSSRIESYGLEVPALLVQQARNAAAVAEVRERRARGMILLASSAAVVACVGAIAWGIVVVQDRNARAAFVGQARGLVASRSFEAAGQFVEATRAAHPRWFSDGAILGVATDVRGAIGAEANRAAQAQRLLGELSARAFDAPDLDEKLGQAATLITLDFERERLAAEQARWDGERAARRADAGAALAREMPALAALGEGLDAASEPAPIRAAAKVLQVALAASRAIPNLAPDSTAALARFDRLVESKLEEAESQERRAREQVESRAREDAALAAARSLLPDVKSYAEALADAATRHPDSAALRAARGFSGPVAVAYADTAQVLALSERLSRDAGGLPFDAPPDRQRAAAAAVVEAQLAERRTPYAAALRAIDEQQSLIRACLESPDYKEAADAVDTPEYSDVHVVTVADARGSRQTFYLPRPPQRPANAAGYVELEVYVDKGGEPEIRKKAFPGATLAAAPALAPHCLMSKALSQLFREQASSAWVSVLPAMQTAIAKAEGANVQARARLLARLSKTQHKGGTMAPLTDDARARIDRVDAMQQVAYFLASPGTTPKLEEDFNFRARLLGPVFAEILQPTRQARVAELTAQLRLMFRGLFRPLVMTAVMAQDAGGQQTIAPLGGAATPAAAATPGREFWAIRETAGETAFVIVAVVGGDGKIADLGLRSIPPGTPLYSPADGKPTARQLDQYCRVDYAGRRLIPPPPPWPANTWALAEK